MPPNNVKEDIIQQQILQAAQQLFQKHGYQKVTMDDVARAIGKGRSSLYYYYKNKDEVFDAVMDAELDDIFRDVTRAMDRGNTVAAKLHAFGLTKIKLSRKKESFFDALENGMSADEISQYAQKKRAAQKKIRKTEHLMLQAVLAQGAARKEIATLDTRTQDTILFIFTSSLRGLRREMALENNYTRLETTIDMLVKMTMMALQ